ncbi:hypothetical protein [Chlorobium sp.]|uniref:Tc-38 domain-containing protein n=1 Tax=Chlorobium sp. TaxID=1095 RepID=UPI0034325BA5
MHRVLSSVTIRISFTCPIWVTPYHMEGHTILSAMADSTICITTVSGIAQAIIATADG